MRKCRTAQALMLSACLLLLLHVYPAAAQDGGRSRVIPLKTALQKIKTHYGAHFVYDEEQVNGKTVSFDATQMNNESLEEMLKGILYPNGLVFLFVKTNYYTIVPKDRVGDLQPRSVAAPPAPAAASALRLIRGEVADADGKPLADISVTPMGPDATDMYHTIVYTNGAGDYTIPLPAGATRLEFHSLGYTGKTVPVTQSDVIDVTLAIAVRSLGEVVVVGYGEQKKIKVTSAISTVSGKELTTVPAANISQSLAGRIAGLIAYNTTGLPGADDASLLIRGLSTTGDNSPLIVIDGIPRSSFSYLDVNDIASISILKDASAVAVYGARAANGVILVTTKRGAAGKVSITYSGNVGVQKAAFAARPLGSYRTAELWNQAWQNDGLYSGTPGGARGFDSATMRLIKSGTDPNFYSNTDWVKAVIGGSALQTQHNLSISGGTDKTRYFISAGYLDQQGLYPTVDFKRYNVRANIDGTIKDNLDFSLSLSGRVEDAQNSPASAVAGAMEMSPLNPIRYTNGQYSYSTNTGGNPYEGSRGASGTVSNNSSILENSFSLTYHIPQVKGLSIKGNIAYDKTFGSYKLFSTPYLSYQLNEDSTFTPRYSGGYASATAATAAASLAENNTQLQAITAEASVNYAQNFGHHHLSGLLLYTQTKYKADTLGLTMTGFPSTVIPELNFASTVSATQGSASQEGLMGVVGRVDYDYANKYIVEFSGRYDGSDIFPPGHRFGFFPAVSAGWRISEEPFLKAQTWIDNLKIRGSWGQAGNNRVGQFSYLSTYSIPVNNGYPLGGPSSTAEQQILAPGVIANSTFTWETATIIDGGIEGSFWRGGLAVEADYFFKHTDHILGTQNGQVPTLIGGTLPSENLATVDNQGVEFTVSHKQSIGKFHYLVQATYTYNRSKVVYTPEAASLPEGQRLTGKPVAPNAAIGYQAYGLYQSQQQITSGPPPPYGPAATKPGDIRYVDVNKDGAINGNDEVIIYRGGVPESVYGLNIGAGYRQLELTLFFQGAGDVNRYIQQTVTNPFLNSQIVAFPFQTNNWTPQNPGASNPIVSATRYTNTLSSSYWVRNADYVRLKNVELSYTLPGRLLKRIGADGVTFFVNGTNLFTISPIKKIVDPETGLNAWTYPLVKVFNAGVNIKF